MSRSELPDLNGILVVDKPVGLTSHDIVGRLRRLLGMKRIGHGGTLDPFATGVLPVAVGRATRLLQFTQESDKGYLTLMILGVETDSGDCEGAVVVRHAVSDWPGRSAVDAVVAGFVGEIEQIPPAHSAIKVGGQPLYRRARAGEVVDVPARRVRIDALEVCRYEPPELELAVHCGKGTYIRALARDIGRALGTGAYCQALRRTQAGPFCLADAWRLDELERLDLRENWPGVALHPDAAVRGLPAALLNEASERAWYHGRSVGPFASAPPNAAAAVRVYGPGGDFVGVGRIEGGTLRPTMVMPGMDQEGAR